MLRRFSVNFALLSMAVDMSLTLIALLLAANWAFGMQLVSETTLFWFHYLTIPLLWAITFLFVSVYDPKNLYKAVDEFQ
ncbi:MAG: hypothetical protein AAF614_44455, partial [Chloroflexota bacterium]